MTKWTSAYTYVCVCVCVCVGGGGGGIYTYIQNIGMPIAENKYDFTFSTMFWQYLYDYRTLH